MKSIFMALALFLVPFSGSVWADGPQLHTKLYVFDSKTGSKITANTQNITVALGVSKGNGYIDKQYDNVGIQGESIVYATDATGTTMTFVPPNPCALKDYNLQTDGEEIHFMNTFSLKGNSNFKFEKFIIFTMPLDLIDKSTLQKVGDLKASVLIDLNKEDK